MVGSLLYNVEGWSGGAPYLAADPTRTDAEWLRTSTQSWAYPDTEWEGVIPIARGTRHIGFTDWVETINDGIGVTDVDVGSVGFPRTISDALGMADSTTKVSTFVRTVAESLGLTDVTSSQYNGVRSIDDGIAITDVSTRVSTFVRSLVDTLGLSDAVVKDMTWTILDSMGYSDSQLVSFGHVRTINDVLGMLDEKEKVEFALGMCAFLVIKQSK